MRSLRLQMFSSFVYTVAVSALLVRSMVAMGSGPSSGGGDDVYNSRAMGIKSAALFRMGGCCQICTTNFYRDLALLEVEESKKGCNPEKFPRLETSWSPCEYSRKA